MPRAVSITVLFTASIVFAALGLRLILGGGGVSSVVNMMAGVVLLVVAIACHLACLVKMERVGRLRGSNWEDMGVNFPVDL
jgi:hypothetical protein